MMNIAQIGGKRLLILSLDVDMFSRVCTAKFTCVDNVEKISH